MILVRFFGGHSPGSVVFFSHETFWEGTIYPGFVITGDNILRHAVGKTSIPGGDRTQFERNAVNLIWQNENLLPNTLLLGGHYDPTALGAEKKYYRGFYQKRLDKIEGKLKYRPSSKHWQKNLERSKGVHKDSGMRS